MIRVVALLSLMLVSAMPAGAERPPGRFVCTFQDAGVVGSIGVTGCRAAWSRTSADGAAIERPEVELPAVPAGALHLVLLPGEGYSSLEFTPQAGMPTNWTGFRRLLFTVVNGAEFMIPVVLTIKDETGISYTSPEIWLSRARNVFEIPLDELRTGAGRSVDLVRIRSVLMQIRSAEKFERDVWLYNFVLAGDERSAVGAGKGTVLFDFGPVGSALIPGAKPATDKAAYAGFRGYGWTTIPARTQAWALQRPERLTSDWIWSDLGGGKASFRVDLPAGRYRARFYGGNYSSKLLAVLSFTLAVDGRQVASRKVDQAAYYTEAEYFRGMNDWYAPGEDTYRKSVAEAWQSYDFSFEVSAGHAEFTWGGVLCVFGLLIAPEGRDFESAAAAVDKVRESDFLSHLRPPQPRNAAPSASETARLRGFLLWNRDFNEEIGPYDLPRAAELDPGVLRLAAARGDFGHAAVTVTPIGPLASVEAALSEFRTDGGAVLPRSALMLRVLKYMWTDWPAELREGCLLPAQKIPSPGGVNVTHWITLAPAPDAVPGLYRGRLQVATGTGGSAELPVEITIHPFSLTAEHPVSYGFFRSSPYNLGYSLRYFLPGKIEDLRRVLRAEARVMKAHGLTSYMFTAPIVKGVEGGRTILDFSLLEEEARAAKEAGLCDARRPGIILLLLEVARRLMRETRYGDFHEPEEISAPLPDGDLTGEFSPLFIRRYVDAAGKIHDFFRKRGLPVLLYLADEPRERNINQWNRNLQDTIRYARLVREGVPGAKIFIDPMRDKEDGVDYLPLLDHFDCVATHPWDQSAGIIEAARKRGKPRLWYFNGIPDRYDFGIQIAASSSYGFWQWHFGWDLLPFQRFHPYNRSGVTLPGPDGPIETPAFERLTAGIGDYLYVATLRERIETATRTGRTGPEVAAAQADLASLLGAALPYISREDYGDPLRRRRAVAGHTLDEWRAILAHHIAALNQ